MPRDVSIPDRVAGQICFVLKWRGGTIIGQTSGIEAAIKLFRKRLERVPNGEHEDVKAHFDVQVRKTRGGFRLLRLAVRSDSEPLPRFFQRARTAWNNLPKEGDGRGHRPPKERLSLSDAIAS